MGKNKSHRASLRLATVIRKKAKAKRERERKEAKTKQYPKRSRKILPAPQRLPDRELIEAHVRESSAFLNDVIRPIEGTRQIEKKNYDAQIEQIRKEIVEKHQEKVKKARETYQELLTALEEADAVLEIVDARDPSACRLLEAEGMYVGKKPWIIVINKIDLVPRESVIRWIGSLKQTCPTIALSSVDSNAAKVLEEVLLQEAANCKQIAVIGIRGVGKTRICALNSMLVEVSSYAFLSQTAEMGLLRGVDYLDPEYDLALETLERSQDDNVFLALEMPQKDSPEAILNELGARWQMKPRLAAKKFLEKIWCGDYKFYSVPEDIVSDITPTQEQALGPSLPYEMAATTYIALAAGEALVIDEDTLGTVEGDVEEDVEEEEG